MNREDAADIERVLMEEVVKRRKLGDYSQEAAGIRLLAEALLHIIQHVKGTLPREKK